MAGEDFNSLKPTPGYPRAKDDSSELLKQVAYGINVLTGGTAYKPGVLSPTPEHLSYLVGQVSGGVGREAGKVMTTIDSAVLGEPLPSYKIPLGGVSMVIRRSRRRSARSSTTTSRRSTCIGPRWMDAGRITSQLRTTCATTQRSG